LTGKGAVIVRAAPGIHVAVQAGRISRETAARASDAVRRGRPVENAMPLCAARIVVHNTGSGRTEVVTAGTWPSGVAFRATPDTLHISTSVPWLRRLGVAEEPDPDWLVSAILARAAPDGTPYPSIDFLPMGHRLRWQPGAGTAVSSWYQPPRVDPGRGEDWVEAYRDTLRLALAEVLDPGQDIYALTGGGLGSGTVTAFAAELVAPRRVHAMVHTPVTRDQGKRGGWVAHDLPAARSLVRRWPNIIIEPLRDDARLTPLDVLPEYVAEHELPAMNPANMVWILAGMRRARQAGATTVLTGSTGDRTFSYSWPSPTWALLRAGAIGPVITELRGRATASGQPLCRVLAGDLIRPIRPAPPAVPTKYALRESSASGDSRPVNPAVAMRDSVLHLPLCSGRPTWMVDVLSAPPLVGLVASLPVTAFVGEGPGRSVARRVGRGYVPDEVRMRRELDAREVAAPLSPADRQVKDLGSVLAAASDVLDVTALERDWQAMRSGVGGNWVQTERAIGLAIFLHGMRNPEHEPD
jgi:hypothetical protein